MVERFAVNEKVPGSSPGRGANHFSLDFLIRAGRSNFCYNLGVMKNLNLPIKFVDKAFELKGTVEVFPQQGGWYFIRVPRKYTELTKDLADRGLVAITATVGKTSWITSLLPFGDGTQFIALSAKIRQAEEINLGNKISISFQLRER